ncbi:MAG TPA: hypothetical protein VGP36_09965 [Mycobacteriales bacterium]|nr:hypothetical protein [Mycobacteriales bacterium]
MVVVLIRMKVALLRNSWRGERVFTVFAGGAVGVLAAIGTLLLAGLRPDLLASAYLVWALGWVIGPVLMGGGDETLRPEYVASIGLRPRTLATGLLAGGLVGITAAVSLLALLGLVVRGAQLGVGPALVAVPVALLALAVLVLASRVAVALFGMLLRSRTGAVVMGLLTGVVLALSAQGWWLIVPLTEAGVAADFGTVLRALPSGWPVVAVDGSSWGLRMAAFGGLLGLGGVLLLAWSALLVRRIAAGRASAGVGAPRGSGRPLRGTGPLGAVVGKELRSWGRDLVRINTLVFSLCYGLAIAALPLAAGIPDMLPFAAPIAVIMAAGTSANLYGGDGTALWLTLLTPGAERTDVRGRQLAWLLVVGPAALLLTVVLTVVSGQYWAWPWVLAALPALAGGGIGLALVLSVVATVPGTDPQKRAGNPLATSEEDGAAAGLVMAMILLVPLAAVPAIGVVLAGYLSGLAVLEWAGVLVGVASGAAAAWWLGRVAGDRLVRRGPEVLTLLRTGRSDAVVPWAGRSNARPGVTLPPWATVVIGTCWSLGAIPLFPQGLVAGTLLLFAPQVRSWFLALYLPAPWNWLVVVAMVALGLGMYAVAWRLPARYAAAT